MPARAFGILQEGRYEDQQRREREEPLQPDLYERSGEEVDHPCGEQDDDRLPHDPPHDRVMAPESVDRLEEAEGARHGRHQRRRSLEPLDEDRARSHSAGSVAMSPMAVTRGAETESRSHRRRWESRAIPNEAPPTTTDPSMPPMIEIVMKSAIESVSPVKADATTWAAGPRNKQVASVRVPAAERVLPEEPIAAEVRLELPGIDAGPEARSERTEDVAPHPDRSGDQDDQSWQLPELLVHEAERQSGEKVAAG